MGTSALSVHVLGVGLAAPGLPSWAMALPVLRGQTPYVAAPTAVAASARLPATERRRAGTIIKVSIQVADEALVASALQPGELRTVFSASEGDGRNCHELCEALAQPDRVVSPTRFTNSVHNAAAGYWHIATHAMTASTSLCAHDASFSEGLMEAVLQARDGKGPVLLVVSDQPYPQPLQDKRPLPDAMGVALVLSSVPSRTSLARLDLAFSSQALQATPCHSSDLEALRVALPAARGLPLLEALARADTPGDRAQQTVTLAAHADLALQVTVTR